MKDVLVKPNHLYFSDNYVVLDKEDNSNILIILEKLFLNKY